MRKLNLSRTNTVLIALLIMVIGVGLPRYARQQKDMKELHEAISYVNDNIHDIKHYYYLKDSLSLALSNISFADMKGTLNNTHFKLKDLLSNDSLDIANKYQLYIPAKSCFDCFDFFFKKLSESDFNKHHHIILADAQNRNKIEVLSKRYKFNNQKFFIECNNNLFEAFSQPIFVSFSKTGTINNIFVVDKLNPELIDYFINSILNHHSYKYKCVDN